MQLSMLQRAFFGGCLIGVCPGDFDNVTSDLFRDVIKAGCDSFTEENWAEFDRVFQKWVQADTEVHGNEESPIKPVNSISDVLECCQGVGCVDSNHFGRAQA